MLDEQRPEILDAILNLLDAADAVATLASFQSGIHDPCVRPADAAEALLSYRNKQRKLLQLLWADYWGGDADLDNWQPQAA